MRIHPLLWRKPAGAIACAALLAGAAWAGGSREPAEVTAPLASEREVPPARLWVGSARVLRFDRAVGTVVVGRSEVIDAAVIDESTVVLTALAPGWTDIVVLGQEREVLSRFGALVRVPEWPTTELYRGTERSVLICDPECRPATAGQATPPDQ